MICTSCGDIFGPSYSVIGKWGMVSGGIKADGKFTELAEKTDSYYKTMEFREDGTFTEICGDLTANGTYKQSSGKITYNYTEVPLGGAKYFAIHNSGTWTYYFWEDNIFTLYDFTSTLEVSMTFKKIE
jgi:hypothetical protein